jgi:hypothetical protein
LRNAIRGGLECGTNRQDQTSKPDTVLATQTLTSEQTKQRSSEATDLVDGYYKSLKRITAVTSCGVDFRELVREGCSGQETAHDTLV